MLVVQNVRKAYQQEKVLQGVTFSVAPATALGICGSNGAGKTTLINIIASVVRPDDGLIELNGVNVRQSVPYRRQIGYIPQNIALSTRLTVRQNLEFWATVYGLKGQDLKRAIELAAQRTHIQSFLDKQVGRCSGGMARRANLAAGILTNPSLILLDEPTAGIDEENREAILQTIRDMRDQGCMVLMVNHYTPELAAVCDRIITLRAGIIAETDAFQEDGSHAI